MILVDSNVPMYLVGVDHPHKDDVQRLLDQAVSRRQRLVSDAEVLQEILHRYHAIGRPDALQPAFDALLGVVDEVFPVEQDDVEAAKAVLLGAYGLSARDAIHVAIMERYEVTRIMTFDRAFDRYPGIERLA